MEQADAVERSGDLVAELDALSKRFGARPLILGQTAPRHADGFGSFAAAMSMSDMLEELVCRASVRPRIRIVVAVVASTRRRSPG